MKQWWKCVYKLYNKRELCSLLFKSTLKINATMLTAPVIQRHWHSLPIYVSLSFHMAMGSNGLLFVSSSFLYPFHMYLWKVSSYSAFNVYHKKHFCVNTGPNTQSSDEINAYWQELDGRYANPCEKSWSIYNRMWLWVTELMYQDCTTFCSF